MFFSFSYSQNRPNIYKCGFSARHKTNQIFIDAGFPHAIKPTNIRAAGFPHVYKPTNIVAAGFPHAIKPTNIVAAGFPHAIKPTNIEAAGFPHVIYSNQFRKLRKYID